MKKPFLLFIVLLTLACKTANDQPKVINLESSLLWEISGNGLTAPSYLFGTYHLLGQKFADSLPIIGEKFKTCRAVCGEVVIDTNLLDKLRPSLMLKYDSLSHILTPRDFSTVANALKKYANLDLNEYNHYKPELIKAWLLVALAKPLGLQSSPALDEYFQIKGRENHYKILGLETIEYQFDMIFNSPIDAQKRHLLVTVDNLNQTRDNLKKMSGLYAAEDLNGLQMAMLSDREYTAQERDEIQKNRNQNWLAELPSIMKQQPTFIAVGAGHLLWDSGLINQLRLKGYTVKPVMMN